MSEEMLLFRDEREGYRSKQVARIVGITYRQLDHWSAKKRLVVPSIRDARGSGSHRLFSFEDIVQLRLIKRLCDAGATLHKVSRVLDAMQDRGLTLEDVTLVTDGTNVYACDAQDQVVDLLMSGQGVFGIALQPLREQTEADVVGIPTERVDGITVAPESDARRVG